jgi:muramidase (phage lysozyme)
MNDRNGGYATTLLAIAIAITATGASPGCAADTSDSVSSTEQALSGETCDPGNAVGIVSATRKAMLDTIAWAEGTRGAGKDGYNVAFTFRYFARCDVHPNLRICSGSLCSTAAGRYQFLNGTWNGLRLPNFWPENQERGAMTLIGRRGVTLPEHQPLSATAFAAAMDKLSWEWASLPPPRYGQGGKTLAALWDLYSQLAGAGAVGSDGCTAVERNNAAQFGCVCVNHQASGGFCDGSGCTATERDNAAQFGCACVDHQPSGGFCPNSGCTARETLNAAQFGCQCVDHKAAGGWCDGSGCTALEITNCAKFGCGCVDHQCGGGFCGGSGCTARETDNCAQFGCECQDHKCARGFCGDG